MYACIGGGKSVTRAFSFSEPMLLQSDVDGMNGFLFACMHGHEGLVKSLVGHLSSVKSVKEKVRLSLLLHPSPPLWLSWQCVV